MNTTINDQAAAAARDLSAEQARFFELLGHYPRLKGFWDMESQSFSSHSAENALGVLSSGEATVLRALASIWLGSSGDLWLLDLTDLAALSAEARRPLLEWLCNPFYP